VLESTANGIGNVFHQMWQLAEAGESDFQAIFTPWFWSLEYTADVPKGFSFSVEDREYQRLHGVTDGQLYWRRQKINTDFRGDELLFQQEYPATAAEAFINAGANPFIAVQLVLRARKALVIDPRGARVLGVDPARYGGARTGMVWRQGRKVYKASAISGLSTMQVVGLVAREITGGHVDKVFVDVVGLGAGVVDRLHELGYQNIVVPVNAGAKATEPDRYLNKRAEMWDGMRIWFEDEPCQIVDSDEMQADIVAPEHHYQSTQRLVIESKEDMEKRQVRSPDLGDALALTFAFPVSDVFDRDNPKPQGHAPRRIVRKQRDWRAR
jgi:hypothetical protein